mmetsp:Transcript_580/g.973  ORF Transcript_580/g.973 Transcript_580/m.973 type:complete len:181 (-) Transcript_580:28-570(-)
MGAEQSIYDSEDEGGNSFLSDYEKSKIEEYGGSGYMGRELLDDSEEEEEIEKNMYKQQTLSYKKNRISQQATMMEGNPQSNDDLHLRTYQQDNMKLNLALMVEKGICSVSGSASLVVIPNNHAAVDGSDSLPQSAKDIYYAQHGQQQQQQKDKNNEDFFNDQWYFVELHQSILQESMQPE